MKREFDGPGGFFVCLLLAFSIGGCTSHELPPSETPAFCMDIVASYNTNVRPIMDGSCAYAGCHDGSGTNGAPGNYNSYDGLLPYLENGSFRNRVLEIKDNISLGMPPNNSVYSESQKDDLTEEELQIIECWIDANYPEE